MALRNRELHARNDDDDMVRSMHLTSGVCVCCLASNGTNLYETVMYRG